MSLYILDTDHLSLHQRGHEPLKKRLLTVSPKDTAITVITVEESLRGESRGCAEILFLTIICADKGGRSHFTLEQADGPAI